MNEQLLQTAHALQQSGKYLEAERLYAEVLRSDPKNLSALMLLASTYMRRGAYSDALARLDQLLAIRPDAFEALATRGAALSAAGRHEEALANYARALAIRRTPQLYNNRGNALLSLGRTKDAVESYDTALALDTGYVDAWCNRGIALLQLSRPADALVSFQQAIARRPENATAWEGLATALVQLERRAEAIMAYDRLIVLNGPTADLLYNRGNNHAILKNYEAAIRDCEHLIAAAPDYPYARGLLAHAKMQICDWRDLPEQLQRIDAAVRAGQRVISPFNLKALSDSPEQQLLCAKTWVAHESPPAAKPLSGTVAYNHDRIRVAYVSGDFGNSAVAGLIAPVFEHHDREKFETIAVSFGSPDHSAMRRRLMDAFESFVDVAEKSDFEIASWMRNAEIDIAVDLMGFTGQCRSAIFAYRPASIQVNFLGFPGSLGASYFDYIIADPVVIPSGHERHYSEKLALLPNCYLPADPARLAPAKQPSRDAAGLPTSAFVFASFNNTYKFSPEVFAAWMRILRAVPGSVLWLPQGNTGSRANLEREADRHDVAPERLIFAPPIPAIEDHLARLSLADLFLDTMPYNSHSTAIDALTAGVPIITVLGSSFASRVAASALRAAGFPELIADSLHHYEQLAISFARDPASLEQTKTKLRASLGDSALFDIRRFTRKLEFAFHTMWQSSRSGAAPGTFAVPAT
jgi:predicted O-linked N-acetylglucosamine transferase (SPINDLY family)